uniref:Reverse transcriptase domain-containing protein n=1 Tax=Angiostrongylus cantonensis TaxID=6313 RepID=A0A0K0DII1_ANGCA
MLAYFDKACGKIGLRLNLTKTVSEINVINDLVPELSSRKRASWGAFKSIEDVVKDGIRSSNLRQRSRINDGVLCTKQSKIRCARHVMRMNDNRWTKAVSD